MNVFNQTGRLVVFIALQDIDVFTPLHTLNMSYGNKIRKSSGHCSSPSRSQLLSLWKLLYISELGEVVYVWVKYFQNSNKLV